MHHFHAFSTHGTHSASYPNEFDSKFEPFQTKANVSYLFSDFKLPWKPAVKSCQDQGGWLAEMDTRSENRELATQIRHMRWRQRYWGSWLGGSSSNNEWRWNHANRSFQGSFTDWSAISNVMVNERCLYLTHLRSDVEQHWEHALCTQWKHFVCQLPSDDNHDKSSESTNLVGGKRCLTQHNETSSESCFRFVKLQYTRQQAEEFCRDELHGSLANVGQGQRKAFKDLLIEEHFKDRPVR